MLARLNLGLDSQVEQQSQCLARGKGHQVFSQANFRGSERDEAQLWNLVCCHLFLETLLRLYIIILKMKPVKRLDREEIEVCDVWNCADVPNIGG